MAIIKASVADFAKFVAATTPSARVKAVRDAKSDYEPAHDFYRGMREAIQDGHRTGALNEVVREAVKVASDRKAVAYGECASAYLRYMARTTVEYVGRPRSWKWIDGDLQVQVNPEVVADLRGERMLLKLWFSKQPPAVHGRRVLIHLLESGTRADQTVGLLLVREGRVLYAGAPIPQAEAFLGAEADAFVGLWRRLGD